MDMLDRWLTSTAMVWHFTTVMKNVLISLLCLGVLMPMALAKPIQLKVSRDKVLEGEMKIVKKSMIEFQLTNGRVVLIPMKVLNVSAQRKVKTWASKQGGTMEYASWIRTPSSAFSKSWPSTVYAPTTVKMKFRHDLSKKGYYVNESAHYRFISNAKIEPRVIQRFAVLFESTHKFVLSLPLNASGRYMKSDQKFPIYLFGDFESYHKAGGVKGSAGVYVPSTQSVLVPLPVLGVKWDGRKWEYDKKSTNKVLAHELTHQLTGGTDFGPWYLEGSAEYVASTRYTHGAYHTSNSKQRVFSYVKSKDGLDDGSGRRLGSRIKVPQLEQFMNMSYRTFAGSNGNRNYGVGLLLTYYFYHEDGRGDGVGIKKYIKALQQGQSEKQAQKILLGSRSYSQLQEEFKKFCSRDGVALEFY